MWVERLADEWIATSSPMFATEWPGFHKCSRGPFLMTFFNGSPASRWSRNFRLDYVELLCVYNFNRNNNNGINNAMVIILYGIYSIKDYHLLF